jgi:hypothetical protein
VYLLFGGVIGCWIKRLVSGLGGLLGWSCPITHKKLKKVFVSGLGGLLGWSCPITHKKKKKVSHRERRARAKAKVGTFRRRALAVALVLRCRRRLHNKPPTLVSLSSTSEPVRWKWKERNAVGLDSVVTRLEPSTLESFCAESHDFLRLPRLMGTLCNHDYHVKQIKSALN